jgi:[acyl-carrier-protein] S-malonyltransferase
MKLAMVFPGQGSQTVGMLREYEGLPGIEAVRKEAEEVLGRDFISLLDEGPAEKLNQTVNTQPAMVTGGYAAYCAWRALGGPAPEMVAGHSLGEYTALVAAGALSFRDCLPLVRFRAQAMQEAVPEGEGAMAAILNLEDEKVRAACAEAGGAVQAVNFNSPGQVVIAGEKSAVERAMEACKARGAKRALPLPVSAPFHSSLMRPAGERLQPFLEKIALSAPGIPLINNVDVKIENDPARIRDALVRQASSPVRWVEVIQRMVEAGVTHIVECGPGKVQSLSSTDRASLEQALQAINGG